MYFQNIRSYFYHEWWQILHWETKFTWNVLYWPWNVYIMLLKYAGKYTKPIPFKPLCCCFVQICVYNCIYNFCRLDLHIDFDVTVMYCPIITPLRSYPPLSFARCQYLSLLRKQAEIQGSLHCPSVYPPQFLCLHFFSWWRICWNTCIILSLSH